MRAGTTKILCARIRPWQEAASTDPLRLEYWRKEGALATEPDVIQAGWGGEETQALLEAENTTQGLFPSVTANPSDCRITADIRVYLEPDSDIIIAVGGGSPIGYA